MSVADGVSQDNSSAASDTLALVQERLATFYRERDWEQFQTLKDLAAGIAIEASELQQLFLWRDGRESDSVLAERPDEVSAELADVLIHCLNFARLAEIDVAAAITQKLAANALKYPAATVRGRVIAHGGKSGVSDAL